MSPTIPVSSCLKREEWFPTDKVYSRSKKTNEQHPTSYGKGPAKLCFSLHNHLLIILYIKNKKLSIDQL